MGHRSSCGLPGCPWLKISHEVAVKLLSGAMSSIGEYLFPSLLLWLLEDLSRSVPKLTHIRVSIGLPHNRASGFHRSEQVPKIEATVSVQLILEMTSHYFCHILFIGNKSMNPKGGDFTRAWITEGRNHWGNISEKACHTSGLAYIEESVYQPIWLGRSITVFFSSKVTICELPKLWKFQVNYVNSWLIDILSSLSWVKLSRDSTAQIFLPKSPGAHRQTFATFLECCLSWG